MHSIETKGFIETIEQLENEKLRLINDIQKRASELCHMDQVVTVATRKVLISQQIDLLNQLDTIFDKINKLAIAVKSIIDPHEHNTQKINSETEFISHSNQTLTRNKLLKIMREYRGTVQESYEYFMGLKLGNKDIPDSIDGFKINGNGVSKLRAISKIEILEDIQQTYGFKAWINEIFKDTGVEIVKDLTKESVLEKMINYKGSPQESYEYFMELEKGHITFPDSIHGFKIQGKGVAELRAKSEIKIQGNIRTQSGFQEWINEIFRELIQAGTVRKI